MSDRLSFPAHVPSLCGSEGELVSVRISVEPRLLEELLDGLGEISFPINPRIEHSSTQTAVEFPAYDGRLGEVRQMLQRLGFAPEAIEVRGMLGTIVKTYSHSIVPGGL